jgi:hypothetical protein
MQRFEVTVNGQVLPTTYATQQEADEAAGHERKKHPDVDVEVRAKNEPTPEEPPSEPTTVIHTGRTDTTNVDTDPNRSPR